MVVRQAATLLDPLVVAPGDAPPPPGGTSVRCAGIVPAIEVALERHCKPCPPDTPATVQLPRPRRRRGGKNPRRSCLRSKNDKSKTSHGSLVHSQLELWVKCWHTAVRQFSVVAAKGGASAAIDAKPWKFWCSAAMTLMYARTEEGVAGVDPCVYNILAALRACEWVPVSAEYPVFHAGLRVATRADLVCTTPGGEIVLVELKTTLGRATVQVTADGAALDTLADKDERGGWAWCPAGAKVPPYRLTWLSRHFLQLLGTQLLLESWGIHVSRTCVLRVGPRTHDGWSFFQPDDRLRQIYGPCLWNALCVTRLKTSSALPASTARRRVQQRRRRRVLRVTKRKGKRKAPAKRRKRKGRA